MASPYGFDDTTGLTDLSNKPGGFTAFLADPNFQSLLAGVGARLDPQGVGGALGGATQDYLNRQALQRTAATTKALQDKRHAGLLAAFGRDYTPAGAEGKTSTTITGDKVVEKGNRGNVEYTETTPIPAVAPQAPGDYSTAIPTGTPPITTTPPPPSVPPAGVSTSPQTSVVPAITPRNEVRNFYPFSRALLG